MFVHSVRDVCPCGVFAHMFVNGGTGPTADDAAALLAIASTLPGLPATDDGATAELETPHDGYAALALEVAKAEEHVEPNEPTPQDGHVGDAVPAEPAPVPDVARTAKPLKVKAEPTFDRKARQTKTKHPPARMQRRPPVSIKQELGDTPTRDTSKFPPATTILKSTDPEEAAILAGLPQGLKDWIAEYDTPPGRFAAEFLSSAAGHIPPDLYISSRGPSLPYCPSPRGQWGVDSPGGPSVTVRGCSDVRGYTVPTTLPAPTGIGGRLVAQVLCSPGRLLPRI